MKFSGYRELLTNDGKQEESEEGEKGVGQVISSRSLEAGYCLGTPAMSQPG